MYDPNEARFWDEGDLEREIERVFDICQGCRLCFNLCPSFPALFERLDAPEVDGDVRRLSPADRERVVDLCYQCKACYVKCPYVPPHAFQLDFPRLMTRARAVRARRRGLPLRERLLADPDRMARLGPLGRAVVNAVGATPAGRRLREAITGIHRARRLPALQRDTFLRRFRRRRPGEAEPRPVEGVAPAAVGRVALFYTCFVNAYLPEIGEAAVAVLERSGCRVSCPEQVCCGMPLLDVGDVAGARRKAEANVAALLRAVEREHDVVVLGPTCSYMIKKEYPWLLGTREAARVAARTYDIAEYLMKLHREGRLDTGFAAGPGTVVYHVPCHLRAQNVGYVGRDLLQLLPGARVRVSERCAGVDGTWGLRRENHDLSLKVAGRLFQDVEAGAPDLVATDCPLAGLQIEAGTGRRPLHPVEVLARAYRPGRGG